MYQKPTFDRLVSALSADERLGMLKSIETSGARVEEPIFMDAEETENINIASVYNRLGVVKRIILFFRALFTRLDAMEILEDSILKGYAGEVERAYRGLFNAGANTLSPLFKKELEALRDSLSCFIDPLSRAFGPEKKEFISFLVGLEIPLLQEKLFEITDLELQASITNSITGIDLRRRLEGELSEALKEISDSDKSEIYRYVQSLFFLNELVFYPFSHILAYFSDGPKELSVPVENIKDSLLELGDVLFSQNRPIAEIALKALFLFNSALSEESDRATIESTLKDRLEDSQRGIEKIRKFCGLVPFRKLLKVCAGNIGYTPESIGGGEDWFALYRRFWEERLKSCMDEYSFQNHKRELLKNACNLIHMPELPLLKAYTHNSIEEGMRVQYETTIAFIHQFVEKLFMREMHRVLRIIHVDGDFYKPQNRTEYTDSCEGIRRAHQRINKLEADLSSGGETRGKLEAIQAQMIKQSLRFKQLSVILQTVDSEAERIIDAFRENLELFINIIKGVLHGESGGRFDTLSNLSSLGGSENAVLMGQLSRSLERAEEAQRIVNELFDLERAVPG